MSKITSKSTKFQVLDAPGGVAALESVRAELLAIPREEVLTPDENVVALLEDVLAFVRASRPAVGAEEEVRLAQLERCALALGRAQHDFVWQVSHSALPDYDAQVAKADRLFRDVEELFDQQVRRQVIRRRHAPPRTGTTLAHRCQRTLDLVEILREHGVRMPRALLDGSEALACRLMDARPQIPGFVPPTEMRNRAYTALKRAFVRPSVVAPEHRTTEQSGVFAIADLIAAAAR